MPAFFILHITDKTPRREVRQEDI